MDDPFKESYNEVLLFLKHQDDKINRILTALAFLTAAGVALYLTKAPADPMHFENTYVSADSYFFGAFLVGLFFAVAIALVALDPTAVVPNYFDRDTKSSGSILFFRHIARLEPEAWTTARNRGAAVALSKSFHTDARRLAHRAIHKVRRFGQATAFVQFTVASLVLLGITRLNVLSHDRWRVVTAILIAYMALPMIDFLYQHFLNFPDVGKEYVSRLKNASVGKRMRWSARLLGMYFVPFFVVATIYLTTSAQKWQPVTYALCGTLVLRLCAHELGNRWVLLVPAFAIPVSEAIWLTCPG